VANVSTTDIRTYLKSLKDGSTVNVAKFLNRKKVTDPTKRGIASGNFKRIIEEFSLKKLELISLQDSYDQFVPLTEKQTKIAKEVYKEDIKKFKNFNEWQRAEQNKYKISDIRSEQTTLNTKPSGIIQNDPNRIIARSPRGSDKLTDVVFPDKKMKSGKKMKQEFFDDLRIRFSKPRGTGLQDKKFLKKYPITPRQLSRVINHYIPILKLKYPKGTTGDPAQKYSALKDKYGNVTSLTVEENVKDIKKPILRKQKRTYIRKGNVPVGLIDFAHRISKDHANALGIEFGTKNTGFDSRLINQIIVRPSEIKLEAFYETQRDLMDKIKKTGVTNKLTEEMNTINSLINKEVKKTSGRLIGVNIDPKTLEISFTGEKKKFRLANLDTTFKELKEIPFEERMSILTDKVAKSVDSEIKRGFRPYDFKEILSDPKNTKTLLNYAQKNAPDIFNKFKKIMSNPMSKQRFAVSSKLPAALIPAGLILAMAAGAGSPVEAGEVAQPQRPQVTEKPETIQYNRETGSFLNTATEDKTDQNQLLQWGQENPLTAVAGTSVALSAQEIPRNYKMRRGVGDTGPLPGGKGRIRSSIGIGGALKPVLTTLGTPLIGLGFEGLMAKERLENDESFSDILMDPLGPAASLAFMEPLSRSSGVVRGAPTGIGNYFKNYGDLSNVGQARPGLTSKALRLGLSPRMIAGASRFLGLPGLALTTGLAGYNAYKNYQNEEGMIYDFFNKDE
jgi:hypothetical protein